MKRVAGQRLERDKLSRHLQRKLRLASDGVRIARTAAQDLFLERYADDFEKKMFQDNKWGFFEGLKSQYIRAVTSGDPRMAACTGNAMMTSVVRLLDSVICRGYVEGGSLALLLMLILSVSYHVWVCTKRSSKSLCLYTLLQFSE